MHPISIRRASWIVGLSILPALALHSSLADEPRRAFIDGTAPGWRTLGESDFANVNGDPDTWTWKDGVLLCTGKPIGVMRTQQKFTNFELVVEWRHLKRGGQLGRLRLGARRGARGS